MRFFSYFSWVFFCPFAVFGSLLTDLTISQQALQQIRALIPERLAEQEFSISVDQKAFTSASAPLLKHPLMELHIPPTLVFGNTRFYFSRWTISGEAIRILDDYSIFEYGPFWDYPTALHSLEEYSSPTHIKSNEKNR